MILKIIILLIFTLNILLGYYVWNLISTSISNVEYFWLWLFFFIESIIILYVINIFYENPIKELEYTIKKLYIWELNQNKIKFKKTTNKRLNYVMKFFSNTLNTLKSIKEEFLHWKQIKWEVELWKEIQGKMFQKKLIQIPSLNIIAKSKPAAEIGWDSYDIIKWTDENYYIYVWDATWHWVWAGFIMMMVNALVSGFSKNFKKWNEILAKTNEILKPRVKANLLMTVLLVRWDEINKKMYMTWAWHEYLLIYKQKQKKCYKIKSWWIALWMIKDISKLLKEKEVPFEEEDIIILYSDWITEAINKSKKDWNQQMFWEKRLMKAIENAPNMRWKSYKSAASVFNNITISLSKFMWYKHVQLDDITLATIQYKSKYYDENNDFSINIDKEFITEWNWTK